MAVYKLHVKRDGGNKNLFLYLAASFFLSYRGVWENRISRDFRFFQKEEETCEKKQNIFMSFLN
jgi:hypothetical protein